MEARLNNIYIIEGTVSNKLGNYYFCLLVAASSGELAEKHVKERIGLEADSTLIIGAKYPNIYNSDGKSLRKEQVKILYNGSNISYY